MSEEEPEWCDACDTEIKEDEEYCIINKCATIHQKCMTPKIRSQIGPQPAHFINNEEE